MRIHFLLLALVALVALSQHNVDARVGVFDVDVDARFDTLDEIDARLRRINRRKQKRQEYGDARQRRINRRKQERQERLSELPLIEWCKETNKLCDQARLCCVKDT